MPYPEGYEWSFPGFYSITVRYGRENNFFFPAHLALAMIITSEFFSNGHYKTSMLSAFVMLVESFLALSLRGDYSIDIYIGIFFGHYFWLLSYRWSKYLDFNVLSIPFHKRFPLFSKQCGMCKGGINMWTQLSSDIDLGQANQERRECQFEYPNAIAEGETPF